LEVGMLTMWQICQKCFILQKNLISQLANGMYLMLPTWQVCFYAPKNLISH
jgi:hypothetical protein